MTDSAAANGQSRVSDGIVVVTDRTRAHARARRHSTAVRVLKLGLPLASLTTIALYGSAVLKTVGWGEGIPQLELPAILPENLTMDNPHYEGFTKDGGKYWVKAQSAQQDLKNLNLIKLSAITGEVTSAQKQKTVLSAARGVFDNKANHLELFDTIEISGENGMTAELSHASIDTKENVITSDQPVTVTMAAGHITSKEMTARQKSKEYTFKDEVVTRLQPKIGAANGAVSAVRAETQTFGSSGAPVDITSNRLDINDTSKIAVFTGNVRAVQEQDVLTTPELEVNYESGPATGQSVAADSGGKVKRIIAKAPVNLQQGAGPTMTSQIADFDAINKRAVLEGSVVMSELPDKRATSDRADIDQVLNTVVLTGNVVVTQGTNELKGQRLAFDRKTTKMQLTAPGVGGAAGRISARFAQTGAARPPRPDAAEEKSSQQGFSLAANFHNDPNAPVNVDADRLDIDDHAKQALFTGAVHATQGDFQIRAAELTASYAGSASLSQQTADAAKGGAAKLNRIRARKNVAITGTDGNATGDWADFDVAVNRATLGGNVVLTRGKSVLNGTRLLIDLTTGESTLVSEPAAADGGGTATSSSDGTGQGIVTGASRPHATFFPNEIKNQNQRKPANAVDGWQTRQAR